MAVTYFTTSYSHAPPHSELQSGTLTQNSISDGTEVLLVPALETGVAVSERECEWVSE